MELGQKPVQLHIWHKQASCPDSSYFCMVLNQNFGIYFLPTLFLIVSNKIKANRLFFRIDINISLSHNPISSGQPRRRVVHIWYLHVFQMYLHCPFVIIFWKLLNLTIQSNPNILGNTKWKLKQSIYTYHLGVISCHFASNHSIIALLILCGIFPRISRISNLVGVACKVFFFHWEMVVAIYSL